MCFLLEMCQAKMWFTLTLWDFSYEVGGVMEIVYVISLGNYFQYIIFLKDQWRAEDQ